MKRTAFGAMIGLLYVGILAPLVAVPSVEATSVAGAHTTRAVITGDWMPSKAAAMEDAKQKALAQVLNAYRIVETRVRVKGAQRRVTIVIEY